MLVGAVILAGGRGERFGARKQDVEFRGKALWKYVFEACLTAKTIDVLVLVGRSIPGGDTRQKSVYNGLEEMAAMRHPPERVVVLEAARPLVTPEQIDQIALRIEPSVTFVAPAVETVLYNGQHLDRHLCQVLQVPQAFDFDALWEAHLETDLTDATDDTILMKQIHGVDPLCLEGGRNLYKVTHSHDLHVLEHICES